MLHAHVFLPYFLLQGKPRDGLCGASGFCHLQQGFAFLQCQVEPGPAADVSGVGCVRHVCTAARRFLG